MQGGVSNYNSEEMTPRIFYVGDPALALFIVLPPKQVKVKLCTEN